MLLAGILVSADGISFQDPATSKKKVLENLSEKLANNSKAIEADKIFQALLERERLGSTGLGKGVAIPHARVPNLPHSVAAMLMLETPINFDAADNKPVDIIFGLLVPEEDNEHCLQYLSSLVTMFRDPAICEKIRAATDAEAVFELFLAMDDA
jgi:PTS system nitrogen regulatory IIA component